MRVSRSAWKQLIYIVLVLLLWTIPPITAGMWFGAHAAKPSSAFPTSEAKAQARDTLPWLTSTTITKPGFSYTPDSSHPPAVDRAFQTYYSAHAGATLLGAPITPGFPIHQGWAQFFVSGALVQPETQPVGVLSSGGRGPRLDDTLLGDGVRDPQSGVIQVPLAHALLQGGSTLPLGDPQSGVTYGAARAAAQGDTLTTEPEGATVIAATATPAAPDPSQQATSQAAGAVFVEEGERSGKTVGHTVPAALWTFLTDPAVSPDGWQRDIGIPLTEALPFSVKRDDGMHSYAVQLFWQTALVYDETARVASPVQVASLGLDYLHTFGPPPTSIAPKESAWATGDTPIYSAPTGDAVALHIGDNFALKLTHEARWTRDTLRYQVSWTAPRGSGVGWVAGDAISMAAPPRGASAYAALDALSPELQTYLAAQGDSVGVAVYDLTRNTYYVYNEQTTFTTASSVKVAILLTFLSQTESQGREPTDDELAKMTAMIEQSDNDAADALYQEIGGSPPLDAFMQQQGLTGFRASDEAWGYSEIEPLTMVQLLARLYNGQMLTTQDRQLALNLMSNIEADQQIGVGSTAPKGAQVAMKDGWVQDDNNLWAANSSGIVTLGGETYIISVYTQGYDDLNQSWEITEHVCATVGVALTKRG